MATIKITALGFGNNRSLIDTLLNQYPDEQKQLLHQLGKNTIDEARHNLALHKNIDTGGLMGSIKIFEEGDNHIIIGSDAPHASYIEYGRGPVRPVQAKALRFFDKKTGKLVFTKEVGPAEPSPFLEPAAIKHSKVFKDVYVEKVTNLIKSNTSTFQDSQEL